MKIALTNTLKPQRRTLLCAAAALVLPYSGMTHAQVAPYPNKPIKFVVAFAPGGPADIIARLLGQRLSDALGQPIVVENRAGAGGNVTSGLVAKAAPDGYTLMVTTTSFAVNAGDWRGHPHRWQRHRRYPVHQGQRRRAGQHRRCSCSPRYITTSSVLRIA